MPYWRLSAFYFFFFASVGAFVPYWSVYLKSLEFTSVEIGQLMAILMATKIISPNIWGWIADHHGKRLPIVRLGAFFALISFAFVFFVDSFLGMALMLMACGFFWNATLPQYEATTLNHLGEKSHLYTKIRVWGSIGFIVAVVLLGAILEHLGVSLLPYAILVLMLGIWLACMLTPAEAEQTHDESALSFREVIKRPEVIALFAVCFLMQASHGPYYTFFSIYLETAGYSRTMVGQLWALGVIAEVVFFIWAHALFQKMSLKSFLLLSLILASLRWVLIAYFVDNIAVLLFAQCLHAASFGIYHAVAIQFIHRFFIGRSQGRGQALYSSLSFGLGGALGSLYSGYLWDSSTTITFLSAAMMSFIAFLIAWRWLDHGKA